MGQIVDGEANVEDSGCRAGDCVRNGTPEPRIVRTNRSGCRDAGQGSPTDPRTCAHPTSVRVRFPTSASSRSTRTATLNAGFSAQPDSGLHEAELDAKRGGYRHSTDGHHL